MRIGLYLRNMGPAATAPLLRACATAAEDAGIDDLWVADHVAIPPEESEGSEGRYLDPLATLAFLAAATRRVGLGTGVLVLPYRPPLLTAKWVASIQELSAGRMLLGVAPGWMEAEFRALGVPRARRGALADETLAFLHTCFAAEDDEVEAHGQRFLFRPRPSRPPIFVGGAGPHALRRVLRFGEGWMPTGRDPEKLRAPIAELRERAAEAGRPAPEVVLLSSLPLDEGPAAAVDRACAFQEIGVTRLVHAQRYRQEGEVRDIAGQLVDQVAAALSDASHAADTSARP